MKPKNVAIIVTLLLSILLITGCPQERFRIKYEEEGVEEKVKEFSLSEISQETSRAFSIAYSDIFSDDNYLFSLAGFKPELEMEDILEGPVDVSILTPKNGAFLSGNTEVRVLAVALHPIKEVKFYVDGNLRETITDSPYVWNWDTSLETRTKHSLKVVASDGENEDEESVSLYVVVDGKIGFSPGNYTYKYGNVKNLSYYDPAAGSFYDVLKISSYDASSTVVYEI
ncbi:MAG: hypothetical protein KAS39_06340, partial [Actinomycetia bacterium]|nr:hypothetical protein [Actinomycetes bacterium]